MILIDEADHLRMAPLERVPLGERFTLPVRVTNRSPYAFAARGDDFDSVVWLAYHWVSERGAIFSNPIRRWISSTSRFCGRRKNKTARPSTSCR